MDTAKAPETVTADHLAAAETGHLPDLTQTQRAYRLHGGRRIYADGSSAPDWGRPIT